MPTPNDAMKAEARKGLEWRREFKRGGTEVGVARARDIANGADLSRSTIARMVSYFARHEVDKKGEGWSPGENGYPSAGRIAWALWGGDPGKSWAEKELAKMDQSAKFSVVKEAILDGIRRAIVEGGKQTIDLREASAITGSGAGKGGHTYFDDAFSALRYANPFRMAARQVAIDGDEAQFVAKTGNAANSTNPWGYTFTPNSGSPNVDTAIWQLPIQVVVAQLPIRTAVLSDVNNLPEALVDDMMLEFSSLEAASMAVNNDQAGSTTTSTGATSGLRGLNSYLSGATSAFGTSGTAITNGIHTIATVSLGGVAVTYNKIVDIAKALPSQYWALPGTAWHMTPDMILALRQLKDTQGLPLFLEIGDKDGAAIGNVFGFPVIPNPYLSASFPIYLANWPRFLTICDKEEFNVQMFDQTAPGFVTMYAEKRMVSTVLDPFAGVRASAA